MHGSCNKFGFKQYDSSMYNAPANGLAEAFNKTLCNLLKKVVSKSKEIGMKELEKLCGLTKQHIAFSSNSIFFRLCQKQPFHLNAKFLP